MVEKKREKPGEGPSENPKVWSSPKLARIIKAIREKLEREEITETDLQKIKDLLEAGGISIPQKEYSIGDRDFRCDLETRIPTDAKLESFMGNGMRLDKDDYKKKRRRGK